MNTIRLFNKWLNHCNYQRVELVMWCSQIDVGAAWNSFERYCEIGQTDSQRARPAGEQASLVFPLSASRRIVNLSPVHAKRTPTPTVLSACTSVFTFRTNDRSNRLNFFCRLSATVTLSLKSSREFDKQKRAIFRTNGNLEWKTNLLKIYSFRQNSGTNCVLWRILVSIFLPLVE